MPRTGSKHYHVSFCLAALLAFSNSASHALENSVVVESKTVYPGQDSVRVAVWLTNDVPMWHMYLILEIRSMSSSAFVRPASVSFRSNPQGRLENSPLGSEDACWSPPWDTPVLDRAGSPDSTTWCSGPKSNSYSQLGGDPSFQSPEGYSLVADGSFCGPMDPGEDSKSSDSASCRFEFNVNATAGQFVIDTCCIIGSHTRFVGPGGAVITPSFTKGVVTVLCDCPCHGDPMCDNSTNILDLVATIDRAFRNAEVIIDLSCTGHTHGVDGRTDVDCSGATDVIDVVMIIDVAVRGALSGFCNACE